MSNMPQISQTSHMPENFIKLQLAALKERKTIPPDDFGHALSLFIRDKNNDNGNNNSGISSEQMAAFLMGIGPENETIDHIVAAAKIMRANALNIQAPDQCVDCCGTGGDGLHSYNISTAVAIIAASCGLCVAKHGNRAASSSSGAADILQAIGIDLIGEPDMLERALHDLGFAFFMAPHHHAGMARLSKVRKNLGFRSLFNILGPLSNPAGAAIQLIGVYDRKWLSKMAGAMRDLGAKKALIVHGSDGLDEITLTGPTYCAKWDGGCITEYTLTPSDFGLNIINPEDIRGGDPEYNAQALRDLLDGKQSAYRDIVLANCAALLALNEKCDDLKQGVDIAANAIDSGKSKELLHKYIVFTQSCAQKK